MRMRLWLVALTGAAVVLVEVGLLARLAWLDVSIHELDDAFLWGAFGFGVFAIARRRSATPIGAGELLCAAGLIGLTAFGALLAQYT